MENSSRKHIRTFGPSFVLVFKPASHWFGHVQRTEGNRIPKIVLYMNLEATRPRGRPRNR
jgi:hypothetical protein